MFPSVLERGEKGNLALTPAQMTSNLQTHLQAAGIEDKQYMLHSFRVGGAASHHMDGAAIDVLMEYVGWRSLAVGVRYARVSGIRRAVERSEAFARHGIHAYRRLTAVGGFGKAYAAFPRHKRW